MTSWLENLYRRLWTAVGGKPWTEIIREDQRKAPLAFLLFFLGLGILVGRLAGKYWWQVLLGFLLGILCGHFWW
jgi:predicted MFS family arabinose efflux permease